jgi:hypothetical protein
VEPVLQRPDQAHPGLLFALGHADQRGRRGAWLLPEAAQGLLHHLPGAQHRVLSDGLAVPILAAAVVAGLTTLFGP